ncbi:FadR family transcriptional regulator [Streptococcus equi subsp. zooepidemicus]|uniref:GntR family regulatory protein n=1 Tax=Streptococcus equi subsp. zooepidemicus (strain H70) TaxID=553483 RepID=C0MCL6_STRS7|nr:FadR/GntR family transcriptional regulator [Streptococcus equi]VED85240.1 GntR family regulatory protein [Streptococcus equi subsp. equi]KIS08799.1 L-lactate dehydrogenase operon regulatory protein [Streptococcus equi subsp. zooepidemicus Sz5]MCD3367687.1 FadR family transcriptional regulator [Streptococcus equi subsp. zooepidemicus]MCD3394854.1 FadR family transcriptional regulator [Streptococcus equi subsp. zooepidemicus]MCD3408503.1 FadR family transcriptional regulator [Streptococcus eq
MARPLVEKTAERLLKLILERGYEVGAKLPNEYELAQDLEVGRSTIREAVRSLATRNVLEVRQGSGTYISSKKGVSEDPLGFSLVKDTAKLTADLFELRLLLEPRIAALTAQHATPKEVEALEKLVVDIEEAVAAGDPKHLQLDVNFHSLMAKYSGNIAMDSLLPVINQSIHLINANYTNRQMKEDSLQAHRDILNAIKAGDPIAAYDAMLLHIMTVKRTAFLS